MSAFNPIIPAVLFFAAFTASLHADAPALKVIPCDDAKIFLAPYVWNRTGSGDSARVEATTPGAYVRAAFSGSSSVGMVIDGKGNTGCRPESMPFVEYSLDHGPLKSVQLTKTGDVYTLPLFDGLDATKPHQLDFYFRAADLEQKRWSAPLAHLRLAGLALEPGGKLETCPVRSKMGLFFGDSITEGVGVEKHFTTWNDITGNNALFSWCPIVASALDCEYGQLGYSGLGMVRPLEIPPLPQSWDHYDASTSRLVNGLLVPEPDYVFCCLGTNDPNLDIVPNYTSWLGALRKAAPHTKIFCIVPPLGVHRDDITKIVGSVNASGDPNVYLVDPKGVNELFETPAPEGSFAGYDGVHPTIHGQALLAANILVATQKILDQAK
jgi:lysophospholipase L1-like esterase